MPEHRFEMGVTEFEAGRDAVVRALAASGSAWAFARVLSEVMHVEPEDEALSRLLGVEPVLAVVRRKSDGFGYLKRFDPLSLREDTSGEWIDETLVEVRRAQFSEQEQHELARALMRRTDAEDHDWEFVALARRDDVLRLFYPGGTRPRTSPMTVPVRATADTGAAR